jgi:hypothetical protein
VARAFGIPSVIESTQQHDKTDLQPVCDKIARQWQLEGSVLVLLDDTMAVVDLVKVKTWWYDSDETGCDVLFDFIIIIVVVVETE